MFEWLVEDVIQFAFN